MGCLGHFGRCPRHPNVIGIKDCFEDEWFMAIVMQPLTMDLRNTCCLHHIHTCCLVHMDLTSGHLKPENIGVFPEQVLRCVIIDLGSTIFASQPELQSGDVIQTTHEYAAPELRSGGRIT